MAPLSYSKLFQWLSSTMLWQISLSCGSLDARSRIFFRMQGAFRMWGSRVMLAILAACSGLFSTRVINWLMALLNLIDIHLFQVL